MLEAAPRAHLAGRLPRPPRRPDPLRIFGERRVDEAEAAVVRRVFDLAAAGAGDLKIVRTLTAESIPAPGPKGWSKDIVRHVLRNPIYVGRVIYGQTRTIADGAKGRRVVVPKDD